MIDPLDYENRHHVTKLARKRFAARLVLLWENLCQAFWRSAFWTIFFVGLWLLNIPALFGVVGSVAAIIIFLGGYLYFIINDTRTFKWPRARDIDRRLETDSHIAHRLLSAVKDKIALAETAGSKKMWEAHKLSALTHLDKIRYILPKAFVSKRDIYALRSVAILLLVAGLFVAGAGWPDRLAANIFSFAPLQKQGTAQSPLTIWITPPQYTGLDEMVFQSEAAFPQALEIPQDSNIKVRFSGGFTTPVLVEGETETKFEKVDSKNWGFEKTIADYDQLIIKQFPFKTITMPYQYKIDTPPQITLKDTPQTLEKGTFKSALEVIDDYGVRNLTMTMTLNQTLKKRPLGTAYEDIRAVVSPPDTNIELSPVYDLSWHPWAGLPVTISFKVNDHRDQITTLPLLTMTLPERQFSNSLARELVKLRKTLIFDQDEAVRAIGYELVTIITSAQTMEQINSIPDYLGLRSAALRLLNDPNQKDIISVVELLWDIALTLEDGNLPRAARELSEARQALEQLLADPNADQQEIAQAMEDLQQAMAAYFQEMARELQKRMAESGQMPQITDEMIQNAINPEDVQNFLEQLQAEALSGDPKKARKLLSQLQQFMDNMGTAMNSQIPPEMEFMNEGINELQMLIEKQQALLDQTIERANTIMTITPQTYGENIPFDSDQLYEWDFGDALPMPQDKAPEDKDAPAIDTQAYKTEQEALRFILGQLMQETDAQLGEIPQNMQKAELEMRGSAGFLGDNDPRGSIPHQERAIAYLQESMEDMRQQMQQMMKQMTFMAMSGGMGPTDPLGRPLNEGEGQSMFPGSRIEIPDEATRKRVQDIMRTLREKSGDFSRPDYELDYFRRLLRQF